MARFSVIDADEKTMEHSRPEEAMKRMWALDRTRPSLKPFVGDKAPDTFIETPTEKLLLSDLAAKIGTVILISEDSYRFHPN